jgi:hypothetical protein
MSKEDIINAFKTALDKGVSTANAGLHFSTHASVDTRAPVRIFGDTGARMSTSAR